MDDLLESLPWSLSRLVPLWSHDMETLPTFLILCEGNPPMIDGFRSQNARNAGFGFIDVSRNKRLNKRSSRCCLETPWRSCYVTVMLFDHLVTALIQTQSYIRNMKKIMNNCDHVWDMSNRKQCLIHFPLLHLVGLCTAFHALHFLVQRTTYKFVMNEIIETISN